MKEKGAGTVQTGEKAQQGLNKVCKHLILEMMGAGEDFGVWVVGEGRQSQSSHWVPSDRMGGSGHKLKYMEFCLLFRCKINK